MTYRTVFDVAQNQFHWAYPSFGLLFLAVGLILVAVVSRWSKRLAPRVMGWLMIAFALGWTAVALYSTHESYREYVRALVSGKAIIREGTVEQFQPSAYEGMDECFQVKDAKFCYSDDSAGPEFHRTGAHGGPIHQGLPVRVTAYHGAILRLEIGE